MPGGKGLESEGSRLMGYGVGVAVPRKPCTYTYLHVELPLHRNARVEQSNNRIPNHAPMSMVGWCNASVIMPRRLTAEGTESAE
jgi:hypothetical protein